jgi:DAK2 domain fusion protein YloV
MLNTGDIHARSFYRRIGTLPEASQAAYEGIVHPVEGTMLTVLKDAAEAADAAAEANSGNLLSVLEAAVEAARDSVARTPSLLPVLKEAGVVDAGGQGIYVLLDGALSFLKGEADKIQYWKPYIVAAESASTPKTAQMATELEVPYGYCTNFVLEGQNLNLNKIRKDLNKKGQSLITTGNGSLVRIHIHSFEPGEIINYATRLGKLHQIVINNMDDQYTEFIKMQKERLPVAEIAIVTVVAGDGLFNIFNSLGAAIIVPGGQTMNPSVRELLQAVESAPSDNVIILPNNKNIILSACQVGYLTSKMLRIIPTRTIPQGIAAFLAFSYEMGLEENARIMEQAITTVKTIEITKAVRKTQVNGLKIKKGKPIAVLDDEDLIATGDKMLDVIFEALDKTEAEKAGMITIYYGAEIKPAEAEHTAQEIRSKYQTEVEVIHGGQPHYSYIISLE